MSASIIITAIICGTIVLLRVISVIGDATTAKKANKKL